MVQRGNGTSASEAKLACAYVLLGSGFTEMTEALARLDENAAWGMLAAINSRIVRTLREESARLAAKGYAPDELKDVADRLGETILAAGQAINARRSAPEAPIRTINAQQESSINSQKDPFEFAALVREAQRSSEVPA